jgi:predicted nucleic acid-binding Zn ribbon protein
MKESNEQTLKEAIKELINTYRLESGMLENKVINSWEKITGKIIAKHTVKIYIRDKKLFLKLDSPALKNELSFAREKLINLVNKEVGQNAVTEIILL